MKLTFYGGAGEVTGANYLLEINGLKILVDCGLLQGCHFCEKRNYEPFAYPSASIDYLFITHAHIDHTGRFPKLYADGFRGKVFMTPPTQALAALVLADSERILEEEGRERGLPPLYTAEDMEAALELVTEVKYGNPISLSEGITVIPKNAGHILGSTSFEFHVTEGDKQITIVFSGDLGNPPTPLLPDPDSLNPKTDILIVESTYGGRVHESRAERKLAIERAIEDTVDRKGVLIIPAFALERTQELLAEIEDLVNGGRIPSVPVFLDSPLAIRATKVYNQYTDYYNALSQKAIAQGEIFFEFPGLHLTSTKDESKKINDAPSPKIIIAGSGMSTGGRIMFHERAYLGDPNNMILMVGFQAKGTLGREILDGAKTVEILGKKVSIKARVVRMPGYSAHPDKEQLRAWIEPARYQLKKVFCVQGDVDQAEALSLAIRDELGVDAEVPRFGQTVTF